MFLITVTVNRKLYVQSLQREKPCPELSFLCVSVSYRLWSFDEHFCPAQLELVLVHVDRIEKVQDSLTLLTPPTRPGLFCQDGIPAVQKSLLACLKQQDSVQDVDTLFEL